jgi:hypothetical protein
MRRPERQNAHIGKKINKRITVPGGKKSALKIVPIPCHPKSITDVSLGLI